MLPRLSNGARGRFGRGIGCERVVYASMVQTCFRIVAAHYATVFEVVLMALVLVVSRLRGGPVIAASFVFVFPFTQMLFGSICWWKLEFSSRCKTPPKTGKQRMVIAAIVVCKLLLVHLFGTLVIGGWVVTWLLLVSFCHNTREVLLALVGKYNIILLFILGKLDQQCLIQSSQLPLELLPLLLLPNDSSWVVAIET